ncbi:hypothetical protein AMELA_G00241740 [Ameiurus melas]|uniref:Uncharacterized protein n=1 Tax=Ameiurus melas TaxID=219545 RepID=A0A7J5ZY92_AMEME|nr:hypothetical protein AMELA_G00241740 [Ameiurus melas]
MYRLQGPNPTYKLKSQQYKCRDTTFYSNSPKTAERNSAPSNCMDPERIPGTWGTSWEYTINETYLS